MKITFREQDHGRPWNAYHAAAPTMLPHLPCHRAYQPTGPTNPPGLPTQRAYQRIGPTNATQNLGVPYHGTRECGAHAHLARRGVSDVVSGTSIRKRAARP